MPGTKLIIEPDHGVSPILSAIESAKESIHLTIFRFDRNDVEAALEAAVARGVKVTVLVAYANRGGEKLLRKLEMRFLQAGMIVARTADDLVRYHNKVMIVDRRTLYVLAFNFTHLDMARSRSFGVSTQHSQLVQEAVKLFEADCTRTDYTAGSPAFIVSPANARKELSAFIKRARRQLFIYDPEISDGEMMRLLRDRAKAGVEIRIIGHVTGAGLKSAQLLKFRLHTRTIIRDRRQAFVGSQSLRAMELDRRREVGIIVREPGIVKSLVDTFESDWALTDMTRQGQATRSEQPDVARADADRVTRVLMKELKPIAVSVKQKLKKVVAKVGDEALRDDKVKDTVKKVVKRALKDAVREAAEESRNGKITPQHSRHDHAEEPSRKRA